VDHQAGMTGCSDIDSITHHRPFHRTATSLLSPQGIRPIHRRWCKDLPRYLHPLSL